MWCQKKNKQCKTQAAYTPHFQSATPNKPQCLGGEICFECASKVQFVCSPIVLFILAFLTSSIHFVAPSIKYFTGGRVFTWLNLQKMLSNAVYCYTRQMLNSLLISKFGQYYYYGESLVLQEKGQGASRTSNQCGTLQMLLGYSSYP